MPKAVRYSTVQEVAEAFANNLGGLDAQSPLADLEKVLKTLCAEREKAANSPGPPGVRIAKQKQFAEVQGALRLISQKLLFQKLETAVAEKNKRLYDLTLAKPGIKELLPEVDEATAEDWVGVQFAAEKAFPDEPAPVVSKAPQETVELKTPPPVARPVLPTKDEVKAPPPQAIQPPPPMPPAAPPPVLPARVPDVLPQPLSPKPDAEIKSAALPPPATPEPPLPPKIRITSPGDGEAIEAGTHFTILAEAGSTSGPISVEFWGNKDVIGTVDAPPFSLRCNFTGEGMVVLRAIATDINGRKATSPVVKINIYSSAPLAPPPPSRKNRRKDIIWVGILFAFVMGLAWLFQKNAQHSNPTPATATSSKPLAVTDSKPAYPAMDAPWENTLGMKFVPVPGTKVLFGIWDVRVKDFEAFVKDTGYDATAGMYSLRSDGWKQRGDTWKNPGFAQGPEYPVCGVNWDDAKAFCAWLTKKEQAEGKISSSQSYRLPTDAEWSTAVGLNETIQGTPKDKDGKIPGVYPWGTQWPPPPGAGNYAGAEAADKNWPKNYGMIAGYRDGYTRTSPVGSFNANRYGLYDMGGNVWQWCEDEYSTGSGSQVLRGASWYNYDPNELLSSYRDSPIMRENFIGFRVVLVNSMTPQISTTTTELPTQSDTIAATTSDAEKGRQSEDRNQSSPPSLSVPWENTLGMKFVPVPRTKVLFGIWDVRVKDFEAFVKDTGYDATAGMFSMTSDGWKQRGDNWKNPGFAQGPTHPVCGVSWQDAKAFCDWLTKKEQADGKISSSQSYRLPTDAEWSMAVGLHEKIDGTPKDKDGKVPGVYPWGTQWPPSPGAGNYAGAEAADENWPKNFATVAGYRDGYARTSPVASFNANRYGLYDMGGNVWQWCEDEYSTGSGTRVLRGASWDVSCPDYMLSSVRFNNFPDYRSNFIGFRCVVVDSSSR